MTAVHALVVRHASPFAFHVIASSIVLAIAIAASYLPRLSARTRFAILAAGVAKFLLPAALFAPFIDRSTAAAMLPLAMPRASLPPALQPSPSPGSTPLDWLVLFAAAIAVLMLFAIVINGGRSVAAAIRTSRPASSREVAALETARKRIGVRHAIDVLRTPVSEAPAVFRVLRPLIVLPADGADTLEDDELESILCHECAHVARRDNLLALIEAVVRSIFWFNPLIWFAHLRLAEEREKACDEVVADDAQRAETYAQALVKLCRAILARPAAGVSCMASAHLKQRMEHIMRYSNSSARAFWHFAVTSVAVVFLFAAVAASAAISNNGSNASDAYTIRLKVGKVGKDIYAVQVTASEAKTNVLGWAPRLKVKAGEPFAASGGTAVAGEPELSFHLEGRVDDTGRARVRVDVMRGAELVQRSTLIAEPTNEGHYTGEPISMRLKDADIRDVLSTIGKLTGIEIDADADVTGKVDVNFTNVPWDQAFDEILKDHGYTWKMEGKKLHVSRM